MEDNSLRAQLLAYVKDTYETQPEYLWKNAPDFAVLRHRGNRKWYGLLTSISRKKLGLDGEGQVDIINVKCGSALIGALLTQPGYLPAYHMNKGSWLTILLDGTVDLKEVIALVDLSHQVTDTKIKPRKNSR